MNQNNKAIVFTDLDGTFLDHHSYGYTDALPALSRLNDLNIPVIAVTSKTMAEINDLKLPFGETPKVAENGMVVSGVDGDYIIDKNYRYIIEFIKSLPNDIGQHITGFYDMDISDIAFHTSLPEQKARLAKDRLASEPFLWSGNNEDLCDLASLSSSANLQITRGGRFYHFMGKGGKDQAIQSIIEKYKQKNFNDAIITIALGDGPNDAKMLSCVDYGIKIPNENGCLFDINKPYGTIIEATKAGPKGWCCSINSLLDDLHFGC